MARQTPERGTQGENVKKRHPKWLLIYYVLAVFTPLSFSAGWLLNHKLLGLFTESVESNQLWAARLEEYAELETLAHRIFSSVEFVLNPEGSNVNQLEKFHDDVSLFASHMSQVRSELERDTRSPELSTIIKDDLELIEATMNECIVETDRVNDRLRGTPQIKTARDIAILVTSQRDITTAFRILQEDVRKIQRTLFDDQTTSAISLAKYEYVLVSLVVLMVAGLTIYGRVMARQMEIDQEERERYIKQLAESEQDNRLIIEAANDAFLSVTQDGEIARWSSRAEQLFGWSEEDALGRKITSILESPSKEKADSTESLTVRLDGRRMEMTAVGSENNRFSVEVSMSSLKKSRTTDYPCFVHDITERKKLELRLGQAQKLESIGSLAAGIAHEINTPIQYIGDNIRFFKGSFESFQTLNSAYNSFLCAAKEADFSQVEIARVEETVAEADLEFLLEETESAIKESLGGVEQVKEIVSAMKEFSHPGVKEKSDVNLNKALDKTITVARNEWRHVAEVTTDFDPSLPTVSCLASEMNQVFLNLIVNASHAIGDKGKTNGQETIHVSTSRNDGWVEVRISDTGPGIPEEICKRIFDPFFTTKDVGKGTGQGLAIAHSVVVDKHDGEISFETKVGEGTTFIIRLPHDSSSEEESDSGVPAEGDYASPPTIL